MADPKPVSLTQIPQGDYTGPAPQPLAVVGPMPASEPTPVAWADVTGKPTRFPPATHTHTAAQVNVSADAANGVAAGTLQATISALAARIQALETAAP